MMSEKMGELHNIIAKIFEQNGIKSQNFWKAWEYFYYDQLTGETAVLPIWSTYKDLLTDDRGILPTYTISSHYLYKYYCYKLPKLSDLLHAHDNNITYDKIDSSLEVNGIEWEDDHPKMIDLINA